MNKIEDTNQVLAEEDDYDFVSKKFIKLLRKIF